VVLIGEHQPADVTLGTLPSGGGAAESLDSSQRWRIVVEPVVPLQKTMEGPSQQQSEIDRKVL